MLNVILEGFDMNVISVQNVVQCSVGVIFDVQSVVDDIGLLMFVVCVLFNLVWQCLSGVFEKVGMKVIDSMCFQGSMVLIYKLLFDSSWQELGVCDLQLVFGDYKLQVGDFDNCSSLQFIDLKGYILMQL